MSASPPITRLWDRLYVVTTIVLVVFIWAGVARAFAPSVLAWATGSTQTQALTHPWTTTLEALHGRGIWTRVLMLPVVAWTCVVCAFEGRRGAAYARAPEAAERLPQRVVQTARSMVKPMVWIVPGWGLYVLSGAQLTLRTSSTKTRAQSVGEILPWLHTHPDADALLSWFALGVGGLTILLLVLVARVRAARLQALEVPSFHLYEDLPQGAALAMICAMLSTLCVMAWGGPDGVVPILWIGVFISMLLGHLSTLVSTSPAWRWFPFVFVFLLVLGDLVRGRGVSVQVWGFAFVSAAFALMIARVHRRALYASPRVAAADASRG